MTLSCSCDYDYEPGDVIFCSPKDFSTYTHPRGTHCSSCHTPIRNGDTVAEFRRYKLPYTFVEINIYDEDGEVPRASHYHCERCAGLYFSLEDLGFCIHCDSNMLELVKDYAVLAAFGNDHD